MFNLNSFLIYNRLSSHTGSNLTGTRVLDYSRAKGNGGSGNEIAALALSYHSNQVKDKLAIVVH